MNQRMLFACWSLCLWLLCGPPARATLYYVPVPNTFAEALALAGAGDGIVIAGGTYNWSGLTVVNETDLLIYGFGVTLDGNAKQMDNAMRVIGCTNVTIQGITFQNYAVSSEPEPFNSGAAIFAVNNTCLVIDGCNFVSNVAVNGGALYLKNSSAAVKSGCTFTSNSATGDGGAIYLYSSFVRAEDLTIDHNSADGRGGALACISGSTLVMCDATGMVWYNTADVQGGGFFAGANSKLELCSTMNILNVAPAAGGEDGWIDGSNTVVRTDTPYDPARWDGDHDPEMVATENCPLKSVSYPSSPALVSVVVSPDGEGESFDQANTSDGYAADGTITVWGFPPNLLATEFELAFYGLSAGQTPSTFRTCAGKWPVHADGPTNALGVTTFSLPVCAGGHTEGYPLVVIGPDGPITHGDYPAPIHFNSPENTGPESTETSIVGLCDLARFVNCYGASWYVYEHDVVYDSVINLADQVLWLTKLHVRCPK